MLRIPSVHFLHAASDLQVKVASQSSPLSMKNGTLDGDSVSHWNSITVALSTGVDGWHNAPCSNRMENGTVLAAMMP